MTGNDDRRPFGERATAHAGTIASASPLLEVGQYLLRVGSSDITDVIANTIGGVTGVLVIALLRRAGRLCTAVAARICRRLLRRRA